MSETKKQFCEWMRRISGFDQTDDEIWTALERDVEAEYKHKNPGRPHYPITEEELQYAARKVLEKYNAC